MQKDTRPRSFLGTCSLLIAFVPLVVAGSAFAAGVHGAGKAAKPIVINDDDPSPPMGDHQGDSGSQTILAAPSNDTCASPTPLALYRTVKVDSQFANDDYQTPATAACFSGLGQTPTTSPGRDVVFSFTAPAAGSYTFSIVHQDVTATPLLDGNEVLYVSDSCPLAGAVNCIKGANRPIQRVLLPSVSGLTNNQSEQVTCVPMGSGQTYYVFFDEGRLNSGGNGAAIEVRDCLSETEPNNSPGTANPMACGIGGSSDVPSSAHCHLGYRGGSDPNGILNDGALCTRSVPLDQSLPESNTKCTISGNACSWDTGTGIDTCLPGEGHCQQLADLDCDPHCTGGPNNGKACATNAFCNPGSAQNATCAGQCLHDATCIVTATGLDTGVQCVPICVGGTFNGRACGSTGAGSLIVTGLLAQVVSDCTGGGGVCTQNAMCPSGQTCNRQFNEGDEDFFSLGTVPSGNKIFAGLDAKAANDYDWRMRITTTTATLQFDDDDGVSRNGAGAPEIAGTPGTGTDTFIKVSRTQPRQSEPYLLYSIVRGPLASAQLESEVGPVGNDIYFGWPGDVLSANYVTAGGYVRGLFNGTHGGFVFDSDCFKFLVHEGDLMSWYGDGEPARSAAANTQFPQPVIYDAEPAGISNFIFAANARKNVLTANNTLNGLSPAVTSTFFQWRASYTGMLEVCYYDSAVALGLGTPGNGNWAGSLDVNCGPLQAAGPGTTTTDVSVEKTIVDGNGQAGSFLTYQIKVTNSSSDIAQEVHLHDVLDPNVTFVSLGVDDGFPVGATVYAGTIATMGGNTTCVATDGFNFLSGLPTCGVVPADIPIDCINTSMAPGAITTYFLTVQVNNCIGAGIDISNTATISTVSTDPDPSNNSSSVSITTTDDGSCQLLFQDPTSNTCVLDHCIQPGTCNAGQCESAPVDCDDNNVCTEDSCDPAVGCINDGTTFGCYSDFNDCTSDRCDPIIGCVFDPLPEGTPCDDGFACTPNDQCDGAGICGGVVCDDGNPCTDDFADDPPNGCVCLHAPSFPGTPCDDGNACTGDGYGSYDACDGAGTCVGGAPPNIDDANACTIDSCDPETGAVYVPVECDDGNACNGVETCDPTSGCVPGTSPVCNDNNVCNGVETCDPVYGCIPGIPPYIDDANACTIDSCDPESGAVYTDVVCDDGNACNGVESCNVTTGCVPGTPLVCDDDFICNGIETCDPASGCVGGTPMQCDDFNVCNGSEFCNPTTGCAAGTPLFCDDGNACNGVESCNPTSGCVGGTPVTCAAPGQCQTAGVCNPGTGLCAYGNQPNGTSCDDGNSGTSGDSCQNGACVGSGCSSTNDPKTKGWYKSLCHNAHSGDSLTDADAACVGANSTRFAGMTTVAQLCAVYDSSHQSECDRGDEELLTLELNICKQRVCPAQSIDSDCGNNGSVAQSESEADTLLSNPSRSNAQCSHAECLAKEISNGHALELNTLATRREVGNVRLSWQAPLLDDGTGQPRGYKIWRRAIGSTAPFVLIGTTNSTPTFLDTTAGSGSWQYDVTPTY